MQQGPTEEQIQEHNQLYERGCALVEGELEIEGGGAGGPGWLAKRRLRQAISCFESAPSIAPANWSALWLLGKVHQRLGDYAKALECFSKAHMIKPDQPDAAREAAITATHLGDGPAATRFSNAALTAKPDDPGLLSNHALALLISGRLHDARAAATHACSLAPEDPICRQVMKTIEDVIAGRRPAPRSGQDLVG